MLVIQTFQSKHKIIPYQQIGSTLKPLKFDLKYRKTRNNIEKNLKQKNVGHFDYMC